ncbi:MAG: iron complex transport system permease protein [Archaeoglobaceae archaeon]|nr:iron complex transport system permease protein [Archaeoglobaceae archaeon]MDK2876483.1 iron complex transport system permease protein [Archaeoglobaceae archaeon]
MLVAGEYKRLLWKRISFGILLIFLLIFLSAVALGLGAYQMSVKELFNAILEGSPVLWNVRIPRIVSAIFVGASLAIAGAVMQCILKNPLASPFTLGISQGAAFGAAIAIVYLGAGQMHRIGENLTIFNPYLVPLFAFFGSLISAFVILAIAKLRDLTPEAIILAGVAMSALFQAGVMLIQYFATDVQVASIVFWTFGDVGRARWIEIYLIIATFLLCFTYFFYHRWDYNSLLAGDETAISLGVNPQRLRLEGMLLSSLLTAVCVSFTGIIGFIGLVSPHIVRLVIGGDYRFLIPTSAFVGAIILLASDTLGRLVISPVIIPVGIITSIIGAPMFIYLLLRGGRNVRG